MRAVLYLEGGLKDNVGGFGLFGYTFSKLEACRFSSVPALVTPLGFMQKATGAQLKDEKYNPVYERNGVSVELMAPIVKTTEDVELVLTWKGVAGALSGNEVLDAALDYILTELNYDDLLVITSSSYLVNTFKKLVKALDPRLDNKLIDFSHAKAEVLKTTGVVGACRNALYGIACASNQYFELNHYTFPITDKEYWESSKLIPEIMRTKWCYSLTNSVTPITTIDDKEYYAYFMGDHTKNKDDIELLGKAMSDAGFTLVYYKEPVEVIEHIRRFHSENMFDKKTSLMFKSDYMNLINISNILSPRLSWELNTIKDMSNHWLVNDRLELISTNDSLISRILNPPGLSFRIIEDEHLFNFLMKRFLHQMGYKTDLDLPIQGPKFHITELTDKLYVRTIKKNGEPGELKMTDLYGLVDKSIRVKVENPCTSKPVEITLVSGIDMPKRNLLNSITEENPKVYLATWEFSKGTAFKWAMFIVTDNSFSMWCNHYSNIRLIINE